MSSRPYGDHRPLSDERLVHRAMLNRRDALDVVTGISVRTRRRIIEFAIVRRGKDPETGGNVTRELLAFRLGASALPALEEAVARLREMIGAEVDELTAIHGARSGWRARQDQQREAEARASTTETDR